MNRNLRFRAFQGCDSFSLKESALGLGICALGWANVLQAGQTRSRLGKCTLGKRALGKRALGKSNKWR
jgi:hypothetical protein